MNYLISFLLLSSSLFGQTIQKEATLENPFKLSFPIGIETIGAIRTFTAKKFRYPEHNLHDSIPLIKLKAEFIINKEGNVINPKIIERSMRCNLCERAFIDVIRQLPHFEISPEQRDSVPIRLIIDLHITVE